MFEGGDPGYLTLHCHRHTSSPITSRMSSLRWSAAAVLLQLAATVRAHGHDGGMQGMDMVDDRPEPEEDVHDPYNDPSYAGLSAHSGLMLAHIAFMVLAWIFVLPVGM